MSWLYSIVFAGLLFSSGGETPSTSKGNAVAAEPSVVAVQAQQDFTERFEQTYPLNPNGRVSASNVNGSIIVEAWDRNEVKLEAIKTADSRETLAEVQIEVQARPESFSVETDYDNWSQKNKGEWAKNRKLEVQYHLWVPRGAALNEIETVNGSVTVSNFVNVTKISAVNGNVKASNLRGTASLSTVNGEVSADFDRLEQGSKIDLSTVNGRVNLVIPSDSNATVKADSLNGSITNDFGLPVRKGQYVGRDLYGRIGGGDVQIRLNSVNGGLAISRKSDGRNVSPATNLLPQKQAEDADWNDDQVVNTAKINREVAQAVRESQREAARVHREAKKNLPKIKPIEKLKIEGLDKIKIEDLEKATELIKAEELQAKIMESLQERQEAFARLGDVNFALVPRIEKKSNSFIVKGTPKVTIDAKGCAVKVKGWDKQEVQYVITEFSANHSKSPLNISENQSGDNVTLKVINGDAAARGGHFVNDLNRVRIEVFVPRKADLKISTNGEIRMEGVSGEVELAGADEAINVRDSEGKLLVTNADGRVRIIGFKGDLDARTDDGEVFLEGDFAKLTGKAQDGSFYLLLPETANAVISSNTEVTSEGFNLIKDSDTSWRIGTGREKYAFRFVDGNLFIRNTSMVYSK